MTKVFPPRIRSRVGPAEMPRYRPTSRIRDSHEEADPKDIRCLLCLCGKRRGEEGDGQRSERRQARPGRFMGHLRMAGCYALSGVTSISKG